MRLHETIDEYIAQQARKLEALRDFPEQGVIRGCYVSSEHPEQKGVKYALTTEVPYFDVDCRGIIGERHRRVSRESGGRERPIYGKINGRRPIVKEKRHIFAVSPEDLNVCSNVLGVCVTSELLGINILIEASDGRPYSLANIPRGAYLIVGDENAQECPRTPIAVFEVYGQQLPCATMGAAIADYYQDQKLIRKFVEKARNNRGSILTVEYPVAKEDASEGVEIVPARISVGNTVFFKFPTGQIE